MTDFHPSKFSMTDFHPCASTSANGRLRQLVPAVFVRLRTWGCCFEGGNTLGEVAVVHAWRGERDSAFEWLERAYARHDLELRWLKIDTLLRNIRGAPRFGAFLRKMNLPVD